MLTESEVLKVGKVSQAANEGLRQGLRSEEVMEVELPELKSLGEALQKELEPIFTVVGEAVAWLPVDDVLENSAIHGEFVSCLVKEHDGAIELRVRKVREDESCKEDILQAGEDTSCDVVLFLFHELKQRAS